METTGDLDSRADLERRARMTPTRRAALERAELTEAARSVAKVWILRHEIQGVPLPAGFLQRHPEVRVTTSRTATTAARTNTTNTTNTSTTTTSGAKNLGDYPDRGTVISSKRVAEQTTTYWCGPTTMQMIAWGWSGTKKSQNHWASRLRTTRSGTAITDMVRVVNSDTGWDNANRAGRYIVLDIGNWSYADWFRLVVRHVYDYRAPLVMHPVLKKQYYSYLDDDASGHFQVGRGFRKIPGTQRLVSIFEPWNQQRFDPSEPYIKRIQWYNAYKQYRANLAHFQHNIGV